jgi:hypothetical protein
MKGCLLQPEERERERETPKGCLLQPKISIPEIDQISDLYL